MVKYDITYLFLIALMSPFTMWYLLSWQPFKFAVLVVLTGIFAELHDFREIKRIVNIDA